MRSARTMYSSFWICPTILRPDARLSRNQGPSIVPISRVEFGLRTRQRTEPAQKVKVICDSFTENSGPLPRCFLLRISRTGRPSFRREAQQLGASQEINGAVWTLADIAYTLMAFGEQALLGDNPVAIQYQPNERLRVQPAYE